MTEFISMLLGSLTGTIIASAIIYFFKNKSSKKGDHEIIKYCPVCGGELKYKGDEK